MQVVAVMHFVVFLVLTLIGLSTCIKCEQIVTQFVPLVFTFLVLQVIGQCGLS